MKPRLLGPLEPLKPDDSALVAALQSVGYSVRRESLDSVYRKMVQMLGHSHGLESIDRIRREDIVRLLCDAQIRKGAALTLAELKAIADPRDATKAFYAALQEIVAYGNAIFRRGYEFECPYCADRHWYNVYEFGEQMTCRGCEAVFQPPLETDFFYKINELYAKGLKNGGLTVLFTLRKMDLLCEAMNWHSGYQLQTDGHSFDVDLIVDCEGALTLFECKDNLPDDESALIVQLERMLKVAEAIGANFGFSTLAEVLPAATDDLLKGHEVWLRADLLI